MIDPASSGQGLIFRPWDDESDLRIVERGGSRGVVSVGALEDAGSLTFVCLVVSHAPYLGDKAPALKTRISWFDEPNAALRIVYDSRDTSVRVAADNPDSWEAWKEAAVIRCMGTRTWKTAEIDFADARFDHRCNGADLSIEVDARGTVPVVREVVLTGD